MLLEDVGRAWKSMKSMALEEAIKDIRSLAAAPGSNRYLHHILYKHTVGTVGTNISKI